MINIEQQFHAFYWSFNLAGHVTLVLIFCFDLLLKNFVANYLGLMCVSIEKEIKKWTGLLLLM